MLSTFCNTLCNQKYIWSMKSCIEFIFSILFCMTFGRLRNNNKPKWCSELRCAKTLRGAIASRLFICWHCSHTKYNIRQHNELQCRGQLLLSFIHFTTKPMWARGQNTSSNHQTHTSNYEPISTNNGVEICASGVCLATLCVAAACCSGAQSYAVGSWKW